MFKLEQLDEAFKILMFTLLATFAGMVGYLKKNYRSFKWQYFLIETVASGFVGLLITLVCMSSSIDPYFTGALAGVAGYLGADTAKHILYNLIRTRTGIDIDENEKPR